MCVWVASTPWNASPPIRSETTPPWLKCSAPSSESTATPPKSLRQTLRSPRCSPPYCKDEASPPRCPNPVLTAAVTTSPMSLRSLPSQQHPASQQPMCKRLSPCWAGCRTGQTCPGVIYLVPFLPAPCSRGHICPAPDSGSGPVRRPTLRGGPVRRPARQGRPVRRQTHSGPVRRPTRGSGPVRRPTLRNGPIRRPTRGSGPVRGRPQLGEPVRRRARLRGRGCALAGVDLVHGPGPWGNGSRSDASTTQFCPWRCPHSASSRVATTGQLDTPLELSWNQLIARGLPMTG